MAAHRFGYGGPTSAQKKYENVLPPSMRLHNRVNSFNEDSHRTAGQVPHARTFDVPSPSPPPRTYSDQYRRRRQRDQLTDGFAETERRDRRARVEDVPEPRRRQYTEIVEDHIPRTDQERPLLLEDVRSSSPEAMGPPPPGHSETEGGPILIRRRESHDYGQVRDHAPSRRGTKDSRRDDDQVVREYRYRDDSYGNPRRRRSYRYERRGDRSFSREEIIIRHRRRTFSDSDDVSSMASFTSSQQDELRPYNIHWFQRLQGQSTKGARTIAPQDQSSPDEGKGKVEAKQVIQRLRIMPSLYIGLPKPSANLATMRVVDGREYGQMPSNSFEWIHLEQEQLNIQRFKHETLQRVGSCSEGRTLVAQALELFEVEHNTNAADDTASGAAKPFFEEKTSGEGTKYCVAWVMSVPNFYVAKSSSPKQGGGGNTSNNSSKRTLLQVLFPGASGQQRGQQQLRAVDSTHGYLHVTQLWVVWLRSCHDDVLLTCSDLPESQIRGDAITLSYLPPRAQNPPQDVSTLEVSDDVGNAWLLQRAVSQTWFEFTNQLSAIDNLDEQFVHGNRLLEPQRWPELIKNSSGLHVHKSDRRDPDVDLDTSTSDEDKTPTGQPVSSNANTAHGAEPAASNANTADGAEPAASSGEAGNEIENFTSFKEQSDTDLYSTIPGATLQQLQTYEGKLSGGPQHNRDAFAELYKAALMAHQPLLDIFLTTSERQDATKSTLRLFHALRAFLSRVIEVHLYNPVDLSEENISVPITAEATPERDYSIDDQMRVFGVNILVTTARKLSSYQYTRDTLTSRKDLGMTDNFRRAYHETIMGCVLGGQSPPKYAECIRHFKRASRLLAKSLYTTLDQLPIVELQSREVVGSRGLLFLILGRCVGLVIPGKVDIIDMFSQQLRDLEQEVWDQEPSREPLKALRPLRNELNAAAVVLQQQADVLTELSETGDRWRYTSYTEVRKTLARDFAEAAAHRIEIMSDLDAFSTDLRRECEAQAQDVEDWRSNTGIIFTTVTVIFLPLSVVASIFGMNTTDVRNMNSGQWVFWVTAVPFTLLVMLITAWWADLFSLQTKLARISGKTDKSGNK